MKKATINDVAREANVSIGTVYRAVNNSGRISAKTRERVLDTVERLGYKANSIARGLALRSKFTILVILPRYPRFFWDDVWKGVQRAVNELSEYNVQIISFSFVDNTADNMRIEDVIKDVKIDAIAMSTVGFNDSEYVLNYASDRNIPTAIINEDIDYEDRFFYYGPDNHLAGKMAAELMYKLCNPGNSCCIISRSINHAVNTIAYRQESFIDFVSHNYDDFHFLGVYHCGIGESQSVIKKLMSDHPDLQGFYLDEYEDLLESYPLFAQQPGKFIVVGHEYSDEFETYLLNNTISALLVQEKACQGYYPIKMLHQYLVSGEKPTRLCYHSNINLIIRSNMHCLQYGNNGCGYE